MSDFRIVYAPRSDALHVWHVSQDRRPVAFLSPRDTVGYGLLTINPDHPPAPLTHQTRWFPTLDDAADFLGVAREAVAA